MAFDPNQFQTRIDGNGNPLVDPNAVQQAAPVTQALNQMNPAIPADPGAAAAMVAHGLYSAENLPMGLKQNYLNAKDFITGSNDAPAYTAQMNQVRAQQEQQMQGMFGYHPIASIVGDQLPYVPLMTLTGLAGASSKGLSTLSDIAQGMANNSVRGYATNAAANYVANAAMFSPTGQNATQGALGAAAGVGLQSFGSPAAYIYNKTVGKVLPSGASAEVAGKILGAYSQDPKALEQTKNIVAQAKDAGVNIDAGAAINNPAFKTYVATLPGNYSQRAQQAAQGLNNISTAQGRLDNAVQNILPEGLPAAKQALNDGYAALDKIPVPPDIAAQLRANPSIAAAEKIIQVSPDSGITKFQPDSVAYWHEMQSLMQGRAQKGLISPVTDRVIDPGYVKEQADSVKQALLKVPGAEELYPNVQNLAQRAIVFKQHFGDPDSVGYTGRYGDINQESKVPVGIQLYKKNFATTADKNSFLNDLSRTGAPTQTVTQARNAINTIGRLVNSPMLRNVVKSPTTEAPLDVAKGPLANILDKTMEFLRSNYHDVAYDLINNPAYYTDVERLNKIKSGPLFLKNFSRIVSNILPLEVTGHQNSLHSAPFDPNRYQRDYSLMPATTGVPQTLPQQPEQPAPEDDASDDR